MTINELLALNNLTANDQIPVWDAEATGSTEPTAKITAQNFANAVKSLASLIGTADLDATPTQSSTKAVQSGGVYTAIEQSTATLQDEIQKKASLKKIPWAQNTTTGTEYTSVVDINPTEYMSSDSDKVVFVRTIYASGRPAGLRIGTATTPTGDVSFRKTVESENYLDMENGIFMYFGPNAKRLVIQEKLASNSGVLTGAAMILAL